MIELHGIDHGPPPGFSPAGIWPELLCPADTLPGLLPRKFLTYALINALMGDN